jgi:hypothetical protein
LRDIGLVEQKGRGRYTYYITTDTFRAVISAPVPATVEELKLAETEGVADQGAVSAPVPSLLHQLSHHLQQMQQQIGKRTHDAALVEDFIVQLCAVRDF